MSMPMAATGPTPSTSAPIEAANTATGSSWSSSTTPTQPPRHPSTPSTLTTAPRPLLAVASSGLRGLGFELGDDLGQLPGQPAAGSFVSLVVNTVDSSR